MDSISERLRFLIDTQAPQAEGDETKREGLSKTLATLERRTGIVESKWRNLMRGQTKAGEETIEAAVKLWPWYAEWLTTGGLLDADQKIPPLREIKPDWGKVVQELSQQPEWSQEMIGERLGVAQQVVSEWATNKRPVPVLYRIHLARMAGWDKSALMLEDILPDDIAIAWKEWNK